MSCVSKDIQKQPRMQTQNDSGQSYGCLKMIKGGSFLKFSKVEINKTNFKPEKVLL